MKKIIYLFLIVIFSQLSVYGQKETSWWHFGFNSGLDFNSLSNATASDATIVPNMPQAIVGALSTYEGCFTVSTYDGSFLFSSDGITIYDKNYNVMPNGTGLLGNPSSTQSGIVIPRPGSETQYYVVTVDHVAGTNGIRYSIVDMTLNGGLGDVIPSSKNTLVKSGAVGENIAAIPNENDQSYWLIHRTSTTFYVFPVTAAGISSTPHQTISSAAIQTQPNASYDSANLGELVVSSDYTKILSCNWLGKQIISAEFNPATGIISNIQAQSIPTAEVTYGATFSPDSKHIYVTTGYYNARAYHNTWINLRAGILSTLLTYGPSNLKAGIDGRLYGIRSTYPPGVATKDLYVIMNPNDGGTIAKSFPNYLINTAYLGLPSFPAGFVRITPKSKPFACVAHQRTYGVEIDLSGGNTPVKLEWNFGDGTSVVSQTVTLPQTEYVMKHTYSSSGLYTIVVTPYKADGTKAKIITMQANIVNCTLRSNRMTRSDLLNSKQILE